MRYIERLHPVTIALTILCAAFPAMFCMNPVLQIISGVGAMLLYILLRKKEKPKLPLGFLVFFLLVIVLQMLFHHNGRTVLFYVNQNRITLEALIYGSVTALMLVSVLLWCKNLSILMTSDRMYCLIGRFSQKMALIFSMTLQFVPRFRRQMQKIRAQQRLLGLYGEKTLFDKVRAESYVFLATVTWAFEHSMDTADSMQARGYGTGKRTRYTDYRMRPADWLLVLMTVVLFALIMLSYAEGTMSVEYYPDFKMCGAGAASEKYVLFAGYGAYLIQSLLLPGYVLIKTAMESGRRKRK